MDLKRGRTGPGSVDQGAGDEWVPQSCTLPVDEQPLRIEEFDAVFAEAVTEVCEVALGRVRMRLRKEPGFAARAAELASRETGCCSFFTFTLIATSGGLMLEVSVAPQRARVVTALARRAADVAGVAVTEVGG